MDGSREIINEVGGLIDAQVLEDPGETEEIEREKKKSQQDDAECGDRDDEE
jgi:hypothetical protein